MSSFFQETRSEGGMMPMTVHLSVRNTIVHMEIVTEDLPVAAFSPRESPNTSHAPRLA